MRNTVLFRDVPHRRLKVIFVATAIISFVLALLVGSALATPSKHGGYKLPHREKTHNKNDGCERLNSTYLGFDTQIQCDDGVIYFNIRYNNYHPDFDYEVSQNNYGQSYDGYDDDTTTGGDSGGPSTDAVSEPGTLAILGIGLLGLGLVRRRAYNHSKFS